MKDATMRATPLMASGLLLATALLPACSSTAESLDPGDRTIYMAAIEPKGTTNVSNEPFPTAALPDGNGYGIDEPNEDGDWTVETYRWLPGEVTVVEGDRVTLEILGVNGASHPSSIEGYDIEFEVKRGEVTRVSFTADRAGVFRFVCSLHQPTMTGTLIVLPSSA